MRRATNGAFVLLDMGIALDLTDVSLTRTGNIAMTPAYASPEQLNLARKRELDCRCISLRSASCSMRCSRASIHSNLPVFCRFPLRI